MYITRYKIRLTTLFTIFIVVIVLGMAEGSLNAQKLIEGTALKYFDVIPGSIDSDIYKEYEDLMDSHLLSFQSIQVNWPVLPAEVEATQFIPVLLYHGVNDTQKEATVVTTEQFAQQMAWLYQHGYRTITLEQYYQTIALGKTVPKKSFLLTFDDGRKDSFYPVDPVLKHFNFTAVIFIIADHLDDGKYIHYLSPQELKWMHESNRWDLEAHSNLGHGQIPIDAQGSEGNFFSNKMWLVDENRQETDQEYKDRIKNDLLTSRAELEKYYNKQVKAFAFPYGDFGQQQSNLPWAEDYLTAQVTDVFDLAFIQKLNSPGIVYNYYGQGVINKRINVVPEWSAVDLLEQIEAGYQRSVEARDKINK